MKIAGIDIGGTSIKLGIFNRSGKIFQFVEYDTESEKGGHYVFEKLIKQLEKLKTFDAIGVSTAGQVDRKKGIIAQEAANIPKTSGLKVKSILESHFNVPVAVENDVNAAALGEKFYGIGKEKNDFLYLAYGTGIGGAIVVDSEIYYGKSGFAAEFGHMITHGHGKKCKCGLQGCYESYASTSVLIREAKNIDPSFKSGRIIFKKFYQGDKRVRQLINGWVDEIVIGLTSLIHIFNPSTIIIGGGIMEQEILIDMIARRVKRSVLTSFSEVELLKATLGNKAGMLGAVSLHIH